MANLYLVERTDKVSYDEYESLVVHASYVEDARSVRPENTKDWIYGEEFDTSTLKITLIGEAITGLPRGCIHASFRAA